MDPPDRLPLYERLWDGPMFDGWHWLRWNFSEHPEGETVFAALVLDALLRCDERMPGYADEMLTRLEALGGRDHERDDYEAIRQWLGELVVVNHLVGWDWPTPVTFEHEPVAPGSRKNPEVLVDGGTFRLGVEVKTPDLRVLGDTRHQADIQLLARLPEGMRPGGSVTLPRDNPVKDFLASADAKFAAFRAADPEFRSVLVIVWDDYVDEPVSALLAPGSGLLTDGSFARDGDGRRTYPNTDAVVLMRHQHQLVQGMAGRAPVDQRRHFLDYGSPDRFPPNALVTLPEGQALGPVPLDALQAVPLADLLGAEYRPAEYVMWVGHDRDTDDDGAQGL